MTSTPPPPRTPGDAPGPRPILVCVAWPYANSALHLGHLAGCYLPADIFARFQRLRGHEVLMVSGSDTHGTPITVSAEKEGVSPAEIAAAMSEESAKGVYCQFISLVLPLNDRSSLSGETATSSPRRPLISLSRKKDTVLDHGNYTQIGRICEKRLRWGVC